MPSPKKIHKRIKTRFQTNFPPEVVTAFHTMRSIGFSVAHYLYCAFCDYYLRHGWAIPDNAARKNKQASDSIKRKYANAKSSVHRK